MKTKKIFYLLTFLIVTYSSYSQRASITATDSSSRRLTPIGKVDFSNGTRGDANIILNDNSREQTVDGFGFALTQGSARAILALDDDIENRLLNDLFSPTDGNAISMIRISIGASDLSETTYTYSPSVDTNLNNFSIDSRDLRDVIPVLQKILRINSNVKILATPWTAPIWMKDGAGSLTNDEKNIFLGNKYRSGRLQPRYYQVYANYFVRYIQEMRSNGITIWGITPQNEPENPFNVPSMKMNQEEQFNFVDKYLGPTLDRNGLGGVKIIGFDHNCDNTSFPTRVAQSSYVDGSAFHLYAGDISAMSTVRNQTGKSVYFTEQFTASTGSFNGDLGFHMENVVIGSLRNYSQSVLEWNLASFSNFTPRTNGGCTDCLGAITVNSNRRYTKNVSYYIIGQVSKFVKPGAQRLSSSGGFLEHVAFKNTDGSTVLVAYNKFDSNQQIRVNWAGRNFVYDIPARTAVTFKWENWNGSLSCQAPGASLSSKTTTSANLTWNNVGANNYYIYARNTNGGSWYLAASGLNTTSFNVTGLSPGTRYEFHVYASCPNNTYPKSDLFVTTNSSASNGGGNGSIISQGKPHAVSSTWSSGFEGWRANDGNGSSRWASSSSGQTQWIYYDLGAYYNISNIIAKWESAYSYDFGIYRYNGSGWTYVNGISNNGSLTNNISTPTTARYILLYSTRAPYNHVSLYEFEVYGSYAYGKQTQGKESEPVANDFEKLETQYKSIALKVFPNPAQNEVNITLNGTNKMSKITITDLLGKVVYKTDFAGETINIKKDKIFNTGIYMVRVLDENNNVYNSKLIFK